MNNCFILLSAGKGQRYKSKIPKQYLKYKGITMFEHSLNAAINSKLFKKIVLVINKSHKKYIKSFKNRKINIIYGGKKRQFSSLIALKYVKKYNPTNVFIHDAARPDISVKLLIKLCNLLKKNDCVVPYIKSNNSLKLKKNKKFINLNRNKIYETQTPQCFKYKLIYDLSKKNSKAITDECSLMLDRNLKVKFMFGDNNNVKITHKTNLDTQKITNHGIGFDVHRLVPHKKLYLGGLNIKSKLGTLGHSDGDPVLHAVTDAILGACKMGDIGQEFSDKNKKFKNIRSTILLKKVVNKIKLNKYDINNLDINIITQRPKISKYKSKIAKIISEICKVNIDRINIKGKTTEKLGIIGKGEAIACEVIASVSKYV